MAGRDARAPRSALTVFSTVSCYSLLKSYFALTNEPLRMLLSLMLSVPLSVLMRA
jgi:hypothetical protein